MPLRSAYQNIDDNKVPFQQSNALPIGTAFPTVQAYHYPSVTITIDSQLNGQTDGQRLAHTFSYAGTVKKLAILDAIFLLTGSIILWGPLFFIALLLCCWGPATGYYSGKEYNLLCGRLYFIYSILKIANDIGQIFMGGFWALAALVINCYLSRFIYSYTTLLNDLSPSEIDRLKGNHDPSWENVRPHFIYF